MKKALVVGINDYPKIPLEGCQNDAYAFANAIERNGDGSPNFDVKTITYVESKSELKGLIKEVFKGDCDTALFYFSGHGYLDGLGGYLVTPDYQADDFGVSMFEILKLANESKAKNRVIILDCCHSGKFGSNELGNITSAHLSEGITILTASKEDEPSMEVNGHGVFTNLLLDALHGGASDLRGNITPGSIYAYIDQALGPWDQRPVFKTNITQFVPLKKITPQVPISDLRKLIDYFPSPQSEFQLDPSYEDTNIEEIEHKVIEPYANPENIEKFKVLQRLESVGLIIPVNEEHMYFAAMNSKSCKLTGLGYHYWRLVKDKRI